MLAGEQCSTCFLAKNHVNNQQGPRRSSSKCCLKGFCSFSFLCLNWSCPTGSGFVHKSLLKLSIYTLAALSWLILLGVQNSKHIPSWTMLIFTRAVPWKALLPCCTAHCVCNSWFRLLPYSVLYCSTMGAGVAWQYRHGSKLCLWISWSWLVNSTLLPVPSKMKS